MPLYTQFDPLTANMQFVELARWIPAFNIHYHLGVDGIAMPFILLNSFTTVLVVIAGWKVIQNKTAQYMAAFLIMSGLINGVFAAMDAVLFYVFFEAMLIPMFLVIGIWGGPNRVYAAIKFFLYTLMGSLLMLVAFIYLYFQSGGSFEILDYQRLPHRHDRADTDFHRLLPVVRGQGAHVAGTYLVAGCPRRGAHRRFGGAGGDYAENRRLRFPALQPADCAGRQPLSVRLHHHHFPDSGGVHQLRRAGAERHEKAHRLFFHLAHGLRYAGFFHVQCTRHGRRPGADDFPRIRLCRHVSVRRRDV